jgi:hypothetical protein
MTTSTVIVDLGMALICFAGQCHPALVGWATPRGEYQITQYTTNKHGYGGDVLVFELGEDRVLAIHRVVDVRVQDRRGLLANSTARARRTVTGGCINITAEVYDQLVDCCSDATLTIK